MVAEIKAENSVDGIYSLCGVDKNGKTLTVIMHYTENDLSDNKQIEIDFGRRGQYEIYLLDDQHTNESMGVTDNLRFDLKANSCVLIKEI